MRFTSGAPAIAVTTHSQNGNRALAAVRRASGLTPALEIGPIVWRPPPPIFYSPDEHSSEIASASFPILLLPQFSRCLERNLEFFHASPIRTLNTSRPACY